jgi:endonuclease YncB( thermonuclease family)
MPKKRLKPKKSIKTPTIVFITLIALLITIYFAGLLLILNPNPEQNINDKINVIEIIDGDTFKTKEGEIIRLICIDTPEKNEEGYEEATSYLGSRILYTNDLRLEGDTSDKYNRRLRWVYINDELLNKEMVDLGYAKLYEYKGENCSRITD